MSDCLLAERRHRHNQRCSERRRFGFPFVGHFNSWAVDQLQNLVRENHGIQLYPHWTNASDYTETSESFDTVALHSSSLHDKLIQRSTEIGPSKLTREQSYISKAMNTPLPFLPVVTKEERKAYAKYVLENDVSNDFDKAAEVWLKYVDGDKIMPKLKSHLRTYDETWSRNRRVQESDEKAGDGKQRLMELNREISPPTDGVNSEWKEPMMPKPLPDTQMQAMHHYPYLVVGGLLVGNNPSDNNGPKQPKKDRRCGVCREFSCNGLGRHIYCPKHPAYKPKNKDGIVTNPKKKQKRQKRQCKVCLEWGPAELKLNCEKGSGNRSKCKFFTLGGLPKCQLCQKYDPKELKKNCLLGAQNQALCKNFEINGTPKVPS